MRRVVAAAAGVTGVVVFGLYPLLACTGMFIRLAHGEHGPGEPPVMDFHTFWVAGGAFLDGRNPYPDVESLHAFTTQAQQSFVYPPPMAVLFAAPALISFTAAGIIYVTISILAIVVGLRLLGVRDWRVYGLAFAVPPVLSGIQVGALSPLLFLGVAAAWRYRNREALCGILVAAVVMAKLFLWPLALWLLLRRRRAAGYAVAFGGSVWIASWAALGFEGADSYLPLLRRMSELGGPEGYQPAWLVGQMAPSLLLVVAAVVVVLYPRVASTLDDDASFSLALLLSLVLSPVLWLHYFVLLLAVFALVSRRMNPLWLTIVAFFPAFYVDSLWKAAFGSSVVLVASAVILRAKLPATAPRSDAAQRPSDPQLAPVVVAE